MSGPSQLALDLGAAEPAISLVAVCHRCGQPHARIPIEGGDWNAAEKWAYLAHVEHQRSCPAAP